MDNQNKSASHSHRSQPAGTYRIRAEQAARRANESNEAVKREADENEARRKKKRTKKKNKRRTERESAPNKGLWKKIAIGAGALILVLVLLALIFGTEPKVHHQLPTVKPPETMEESV